MITKFGIFESDSLETKFQRNVALLNKVADHIFYFTEEVTSAPYKHRENPSINNYQRCGSFAFRSTTLELQVRFFEKDKSIIEDDDSDNEFEILVLGDFLHPEVQPLLEYFVFLFNPKPSTFNTSFIFKVVDTDKVLNKLTMKDFEKFKNTRKFDL